MFVKLLVPVVFLSTFCLAQEKPAQPVTLPRYENTPYFEAEILGWVAKQEGNDYAATGAAITVPGTSDPNTGLTPGPVVSGKVYSPDADIKPGFKVGAGLNLTQGRWDLFSQYTYFFTKGDSLVEDNDLNTGILPLFSYSPNNSILSSTTFVAASGATGFVSAAQSYWALHFNNINLEMRREVRLFPTLSLRPHFGFQGTWQKQETKTFYTVSAFTAPRNKLGSNEVAFSQTSWGVGLRAGLDSVWKCCEHVGLFANTAVSALWGKFNARGKSYDTNFSAGYTNTLIANQLNSLYTVSPVIEALIGLQFDWTMYQKYYWLAQVGWEEQVWFFQNQHSSSIADTSLILQGLTAKLQFDF